MDLYLTDEEIMKQDQEYYYNKGKTEIIIKMFEDNVPIDTIVGYANMSKDDVEKIINEYK